jgi:hypothetical protein
MFQTMSGKEGDKEEGEMTLPKILLIIYLVYTLTLSVLTITPINAHIDHTPTQHGYSDGVADGQRSARDS